MADYTNKGEYRSPNASKVFKNQKKSKPSDNLKETEILQDPEKEAQEEFVSTGERFCIQCHNPVAFLTGEELSNFSTL